MSRLQIPHSLLPFLVRACTDLNSNDLELTIVRGVNYNVSNPKDVDTYVKWEFPWPQVSRAAGGGVS